MLKKPFWLNKKISLRECVEVKRLLRDRKLHTVCEEAQCPNIGECFSKRQATFIILGEVCTRGCLFCAVTKGRKPSAPDPEEPQRIAQAVKELGLTHVVVTSVTRDDLPDGGAEAFAHTIAALRADGIPRRIEVLIPDFQADGACLQRVAAARPDIIAHNVEMVPRLYSSLRPGGASYARSLEVLWRLHALVPDIPLKSGIMLGLGETEPEVLQVFADLRTCGCSYLSLGQYLAPGNAHAPVKEYVPPARFEEFRREALAAGFTFVKSGPYVRSSYAAGEYCAAPAGQQEARQVF